MRLPRCAVCWVLVWGWSFRSVFCQDDYEPEEDMDVDEDFMSPSTLMAIFKKLDGDGDGKVPLVEILEFAKAISGKIAQKDLGPILEEIDANKDGAISLQEHLQDIHNQAVDGGDAQDLKELEHHKELEAAKFRAADTNGDGILDSSEVVSVFYPETHDGVLSVSVANSMKLKDADVDGKLSAVEFWEADEGSDDLSEAEFEDFKALDSNGDGFLNLEELKSWESGRFHLLQAMESLFNLADKDRDTFLTADELAAAREDISRSDAQYHLFEWAEHLEL